MWKVTYLYNGTLKCFNDDDDINCPTYIPEGKTPEKAISDTVDYILEIYHCNCLDAEYKDGELIVTDPVDGEFICKYSNFEARKYYTLIGVDGKPYLSETPGTLGGYKVKKIYGRLDCPSAKRHIEKGQYVKNRAFFADEETAIAAGYRPCGICMKEEYRKFLLTANLMKDEFFIPSVISKALEEGKISAERYENYRNRRFYEQVGQRFADSGRADYLRERAARGCDEHDRAGDFKSVRHRREAFLCRHV